MTLRFDLSVADNDDVHVILERNYNAGTVKVTVDRYGDTSSVVAPTEEFIELLKAAGFHDGLDGHPLSPAARAARAATSPDWSATVIDTSGWERTPGGKLICPDCGGNGWPVEGRGPSWLDKHLRHEDCPDCGMTFTVRGLKAHRRKHRPT